jgi:hypothetical protein
MPEDEWKDMQKQIDKEAKEEPPIDDTPQVDQDPQQTDPRSGQEQPTEEGLTIINRKKITNFSKRAQK